MADLEVRVTDGPYKGDYAVNLNDLTASESLAFRQTLGVSLTTAFSAGEADLWAVAGIIWLLRRRTSKALPYDMVAKEITYGSIEQVDDEAPVEEDPTDPLS